MFFNFKFLFNIFYWHFFKILNNQLIVYFIILLINFFNIIFSQLKSIILDFIN
jgi:hypothetical protein